MVIANWQGPRFTGTRKLKPQKCLKPEFWLVSQKFIPVKITIDTVNSRNWISCVATNILVKTEMQRVPSVQFSVLSWSEILDSTATKNLSNAKVEHSSFSWKLFLTPFVVTNKLTGTTARLHSKCCVKWINPKIFSGCLCKVGSTHKLNFLC